MSVMDHPSQRQAKLEAARKVAAMSALRCAGETSLATETLADFRDSAELTNGYQAVVEQLAIELGRAIDRTPQEVLSELAARCSGASAIP